jgi:hypothetical protein
MNGSAEQTNSLTLLNQMVYVNGRPVSAMSSEELDALIKQTIDEIRTSMEDADERDAIQYETSDDATTIRALHALEEPDTSWGKHAVAISWLRNYAPNAGLFRKILA